MRALLAAVAALFLCALLGATIAQADGGELAEVRIAVRAGEDGRIEFALQTRTTDSAWSERILPRARRFPANAAVDRWLSSSPITVPAGFESDLSVRVKDGNFVVRADGLNYDDNCGFVWLRRLSRVVTVSAQHPPICDEWTSPNTVLSVADFRPAFDPADPQQHLVYDWESHLEASLLPPEFQAPITIEDARAIARAVYADHFRGRQSPPRVFHVGTDALDGFAGNYRWPDHVIELTSEGLDASSVLHELGHALVRGAAATSSAHGPAFAAQMLALWQRYLPNFDAAAALRAAAEHDVAVGASPPAAATGGAVQLNAARTALRVSDDSILAAGAPPALLGVPELEGDIIVRIAARRLQNGRIEFALQPRKSNGEWGGRMYPSARFLPTDPPRGRWLSSSPVVVAPAAAAVSVRVRDNAFVFNVGGADLADPCGSAELLRGNRAVWLTSLDHATCSDWSSWSAILFTDDTNSDNTPAAWKDEFEDWLWELRNNNALPDLLNEEITIGHADALADAMFADHLDGRIQSPIAFTLTDDGVKAEHRIHGQRGSWRSRGWTTPEIDLGFVFRAVARAMTDVDGGFTYVGQSSIYDERFIAQLLALWERYLPNFDADAARHTARLHSLRYTDATPVPATGSLFDRAVVQTLLGVQ